MQPLMQLVTAGPKKSPAQRYNRANGDFGQEDPNILIIPLFETSVLSRSILDINRSGINSLGSRTFNHSAYDQYSTRGHTC